MGSWFEEVSNHPLRIMLHASGKKEQLHWLATIPNALSKKALRIITGRGKTGSYTMNSPTDGKLVVPVILARKYQKGKYGKHGVEWFAYVAYRFKSSIQIVYQDYRRRFGIESSYSLMHAVRARTRVRQPALDSGCRCH